MSSKTKAATGKKPGTIKSQQTRQKSAQTNKKSQEKRNENSESDLDFLFTGESPESKEDKWLSRIKQLVEKKKKMPADAKYSETLRQLYDALLKELCTRCGEDFNPIFTNRDSGQEEQHSTSDRDDTNKRELESKLSDMESKNKELQNRTCELEQKLSSVSEEKKNLEHNNKECQSEVQIKTTELSKMKEKLKELEQKLNAEKEKLMLKDKDPMETKIDNDLQNKIKQLEKTIENMKNNSQKESSSLTDELENLKDHNLKIKQQLDEEIKSHEEETSNRISFEKENNELKKKQTDLQEELQILQSNNSAHNKTQDTNKEQITRLIKENESLKLSKTKNDEHLQRKKEEIKKLNDDFNVMKAEKESLQSLLDDINSQLEKEKSKLKEEKKNAAKAPDQKLKELQDENEKLRDRLSQVAGNKLTDGNPAIADLGDPNRPTQLGEKFSELYDNEWTDAMEELGNAGDEKSNITTLRNIVEKSYEFGKNKAEKYVKGLEKALLDISNSIQVTPTISKHIKDHRKNTALLVVDSLYKSFLSSHTEFNVGGNDVKTFIKKTLSLCWLMSIQDPPVILTTELSGKFDTDRFRHYTKSGSTVDYVVWPVVFLHEGGPIICKGVAQGK